MTKRFQYNNYLKHDDMTQRLQYYNHLNQYIYIIYIYIYRIWHLENFQSAKPLYKNHGNVFQS